MQNKFGVKYPLKAGIAQPITGVQLVFVSCIGSGFFYQALVAMADAPNWNDVTKVIQVFSNTVPSGYNAPWFGAYDGGFAIFGAKSDGSTPWDVPVQIQYNIIPMTDGLISQPDPQH